MTWSQMKQYRQLVARAAGELGINPADKTRLEEYRKRVLLEETGKDSSLKCNNTSDYERLMMRHAADAGDYELASRFCLGDDRRLVAMIDDCTRQIAELSDRPDMDELAYLHGILRQAGLVRRRPDGRVSREWWMDFDRATPRLVFCILDKYRRRLVRQFNTAHRQHAAVAYHFGATWSLAS